MAAPLSADRMIAALRAEGVDPQEYKSWRTNNRNHVGPWGDVKGLVVHHTVSSDTTGIVEVCYSGRSDLPGPLCHAVLRKSGAILLVGNGRANHAGSFAQNAHNAVLAESSVHPAPDSAEPVDANARYYGLEIINLGNGTDVYPWVQYAKAVKWATAICRAHGWSEHSVIGHKEGTRRKIDPKGPVMGPDGKELVFNMAAFRGDVGAALALPAGVWPNQEEDVALTDQEKNDIAVLSAQKVWAASINNRFRPDAAGIPRDIPAALYLEYGDGHYDDLVARLDALKEQIETVEVGGVDLDALAVKVADELHRRMAQ